MYKLTTKISMVALALALGLAATENAQAGWLEKATGGKVSTPEPIRKIAPNGIRLGRIPQESPSYIAVITPAFIDNQGRIWSGSSRGGSRGHVMRQAKIQHNGAGQAYWVDPKGKVKSRHAPQHDLRVTYRLNINPNTGVVYQTKYLGSKQVGNRKVGNAVLQYAQNGRPLFKYGSHWTWANKPWQSQQPQLGTPKFQNQDPGAQLGTAIAELIKAAAK